MKTVYEHLKNNFKYKRYDGEFGIEIETETKNPYDPPKMNYWNSVGDGSLRDFGMEYVLKQPLKYGKELDAAFDEFEKSTKGIKFIKDSISTSVHVHVNVLNESMKTLGNFLTVYALFENLLIRYSGPDRLSNLFCLPIIDSEETYENIVKMFRSAEAKSYKGFYFNGNSVKYAALNLGAITGYGSVELRSFRGETDIKEIHKWVSIINTMLQYSRNPDLSPHDIVEVWRKQGLDLLDHVFGKYANDLRVEKTKELVESNVFYAVSIAFAVKNWQKLDQEEKKETLKFSKKEMDKWAVYFFGVKADALTEAQIYYIQQHLQKEKMNRPYNPMPMANVPRQRGRNAGGNAIGDGNLDAVVRWEQERMAEQRVVAGMEVVEDDVEEVRNDF